jgi:antitoxin (DNA-binding transcriptional repressor) of toxin-antitoxin stability system
MYHMQQASIRDLRYKFRKVEDLLKQGEEIQITKRKRVIARLVPEAPKHKITLPDFAARLEKTYGDRKLKMSGAELIARDRERF